MTDTTYNRLMLLLVLATCIVFAVSWWRGAI